MTLVKYGQPDRVIVDQDTAFNNCFNETLTCVIMTLILNTNALDLPSQLDWGENANIGTPYFINNSEPEDGPLENIPRLIEKANPAHLRFVIGGIFNILKSISTKKYYPPSILPTIFMS